MRAVYETSASPDSLTAMTAMLLLRISVSAPVDALNSRGICIILVHFNVLMTGAYMSDMAESPAPAPVLKVIVLSAKVTKRPDSAKFRKLLMSPVSR